MENDTLRLLRRFGHFLLFTVLLSLLSCSILHWLGLKIFLVCGSIFAGAVLAWIACRLDDKGKLDTSKIIIFMLIYIGAMMSGFSYYLAYIQREEIAESLSKAAIVELVAPAVMILIKSLVENLSINNEWPDRPAKSTSDQNSEI